ncbi:MAG: ABC transporter permease [Elusimicrobiota bacterium]|jgi:putative ABC transport system permease protein|nr:ABC transporter permease [Elusimicrobiota bacterium]
MRKNAFYLKMVSSSLIRRKSRMLTALLAVIIGAAVLSGLITIYYDIPRQMGKEFRSYGANMLFLPSENKSRISITAIKQAALIIPQESISGIAPFRYKTVKINEQPFMAAGTDLEEVKKTRPFWHISGHFPENKNEVLIGKEIADRVRLMTDAEFSIEATDINNKTVSRKFKVSGIITSGSNDESVIFMSLQDFGEMLGQDGADLAEVSVAMSAAELQKTVSKINSISDALSANIIKRVAKSEMTVLSKLESLVYLTSIIVLLLTMICVATTMTAVVAERRKEIGLKKALGATNFSIIMEFLGEDILIGGIGGILGSFAGFALAQIVSVNVFSRSIELNFVILPLSVLFSIFVAIAASWFPIRSATVIDPALVLRGE